MVARRGEDPSDTETRVDGEPRLNLGMRFRGPPETRQSANLTELREGIVAETVQAGAAKPSPEVAAEYAAGLAHSAKIISKMTPIGRQKEMRGWIVCIRFEGLAQPGDRLIVLAEVQFGDPGEHAPEIDERVAGTEV